MNTYLVSVWFAMMKSTAMIVYVCAYVTIFFCCFRVFDFFLMIQGH